MSTVWFERERDYRARLCGDFASVQGVYKELMDISQQRELSFGEKKFLRAAEELIAQEKRRQQWREQDSRFPSK